MNLAGRGGAGTLQGVVSRFICSWSHVGHSSERVVFLGVSQNGQISIE